jgi:hypothetical protein
MEDASGGITRFALRVTDLKVDLIEAPSSKVMFISGDFKE